MLAVLAMTRLVMMTMNCKLVALFVGTLFIMASARYEMVILDVDAFDNYESIATMGEVERRHFPDR